MQIGNRHAIHYIEKLYLIFYYCLFRIVLDLGHGDDQGACLRECTKKDVLPEFAN